ncbi:MAG: hypothetical protein RQ856_03640 [Candidatus Izemoplasmatales bacterium]|nr:hypothetical protein [Candidatus Izemoplasmatales bacterium]
MKKVVLFLLAISIGFLFIGCDQTNEIEIESEEQLFTLQALSSTALLSYSEINVEETAYLPLAEGETEEPIITAEVENIDYYVEMMDLFLGDDNLDVVSETSDNELYEYKTIYTVININGEEVSYVFYYNEFNLEEESQEIATSTYSEESEGTQTRRFHFEDEDDNLVAQGLEGVLIYGDVTYNIEGKKVVNSQQEIYRLRSYIDEENYVMVNYQNDVTDRDREKFFFKLVENGEIVNESKVMMFTRDNRLHLKLEFTDGDNYASYMFNIRTEENIKYIHIVYEIINGEEGEEGVVRLTAETDPETGEVVYSYSMSPNRAGREYQKSFHHHYQSDGFPMQQNR